MKVLCINAREASYITEGKIYELLRQEGRFVFIISDRGRNEGAYSSHRFKKIMDENLCNNLPDGWRYCQCGSTTSNPDMCCDCNLRRYK